jgi:hypothetical protein
MSTDRPSHASSRIPLRSHHKNLRPLATNQTDASQPRDYNQSSHIPESDTGRAPDSATSLASPTMAAVRQYYHDTGLMTALQCVPSLQQYSLNAHQYSLNSRQDFPRRHSILSPGSLATHMGAVTVSSPSSSSPGANMAVSCHSIAEESRQILVSGIIHSELAKLGSVVSKRPLQPDLLPHTVGKIPSEYTHNRLREWGPVYLGNIATADVFVKAMHLRKSLDTRSPLDAGRSSEKTVGDNPSIDPNKEVIIQARVIPKARERKPFLIQRRFSLQAMRASSQRSSARGSITRNRQEQETSYKGKTNGANNQTTYSRSKSTSPEPSDKLSKEYLQNASSTTKPTINCQRLTGRQTMPIRQYSIFPANGYS